MRKLLVILIVLALLVAAVDFVGRRIVESRIGEAIAERSGIRPAPAVSIHGLSFLWQAVSGKYQHVSLTLTDADLPQLSGVSTQIHAYDIDMPLGAAVAGDITPLTVDSAEATASIPLAEVARMLGSGVSVAATDDGALLLQTSVDVFGRDLLVSSVATATVSDGVLRITAGPPTAEGDGIPQGITDTLVRTLSLEIPLSGLPVDLTSATVSAVGDSLTVRTTLEDFSMADLRSTG